MGEPADLPHLETSEGVDANHTARARIHYLIAQNNALIAQVQFADAKAAALLALVGLLALKGPVPPAGLGQGLLGTGVIIANVAAVLACLWAIMPRYPAPAVRRAMLTRDRFSWPSLAAPGFDGAAYERLLRGGELSSLITSLAESNVAISRILLRKFRTMRVAFGLAMASVVMITLNEIV
jgi:hypothetical protein